jgi:hypothetical protein
MDLRKSFPGGEIKVTNTEIDLMPLAVREGLYGLVEGLSEGVDCIVSGVNAILGGGDLVVERGFVFIDGEFLLVDAATYPEILISGIWEFEKQVNSTEPGYDRNYRDGSTHNVADIIRAVPVEKAAPTGDLNVIDGVLLYALLTPQSDWDEADPNAPEFIQNKPTASFEPLASGRIIIGDFGGSLVGVVLAVTGDFTNCVVSQNLNAGADNLYTLTFPNVGTTDYQCVFTHVSKSGNFDLDNDIVWCQRSAGNTSVQIAGRQFAAAVDNIDLIVSLIPYNNTP